jgi:hypothetical protein
MFWLNILSHKFLYCEVNTAELSNVRWVFAQACLPVRSRSSSSLDDVQPGMRLKSAYVYVYGYIYCSCLAEIIDNVELWCSTLRVCLME